MNNHILTTLHLVATEGSTNLFLTPTGTLFPRGPYEPKGCIGQHLYLTSDEEIKEGDWYIDDIDAVRKSITSDKDYWEARKDYRKIVATTNKELWPRAWNDDKNKNPLHIFGDVVIHKIPQSFIELYIERYNEGSSLKQVWLEMTEMGPLKDFVKNKDNPIVQAFSPHREPAKLKLNPSGEVVWKLEEEKMYTRNEFYTAILYTAETMVTNYEKYGKFTKKEFNEWFNENYPK